jgi:glycosyltransferase involved in cell wall biosynthesis
VVLDDLKLWNVKLETEVRTDFMHVDHFIQRYPPALGGSESTFERMSRWHVSQGDSVRVWTTTALDLTALWWPGQRELPEGEEVCDGVIVKRYRPELRFRGRRYLLKALNFWPSRSWQSLTLPVNPVCGRMWREAAADRSPCDAVHASAFPYAWIVHSGLRRARAKQVPFVLSPYLHLGDPTDPRDKTRRAYTAKPLVWLLRQADRIFVQSETEADACAGFGIPRERIVLQGMGVTFEECTGGSRVTGRRRWDLPDDAFVVGMLGNHSIEKGSVDLLKATMELHRKGLRPRVLLAGPSMPNFEQYWSQVAPLDWVTRVGRLTTEEKRDFYASIDLFAMPSRSDSFGIVFVEAWANGVPVVGYRAGGVADLIHHDRDGWLVPCGDLASLARTLETAMADPDRRTAYGFSGLQRAGREFDWDDKFRIVREAILSVVSG